jgi:DNA (cytosine-5)-methyltransferase 1
LTIKKFKYIDLFAGIGGFHLALDGLGGECVFASEIDVKAAEVYKINHLAGREEVMHGDIIALTEPTVSSLVPEHDVLAAGFPCQPFSKGGFQKGINEARGTLFFNIAKILKDRNPRYFVLENVRNLIGPRHRDTWATIYEILTGLGYWVSTTPTVLSPHLIPPESGGSPQVRERVYIIGIKKELLTDKQIAENEKFVIPMKPFKDFSATTWNAKRDISEKGSHGEILNTDRKLALDIWADFLQTVGTHGSSRSLPGFPIWEWALAATPNVAPTDPKWKEDFLRKNSQLYVANKDAIDSWRIRNPLITQLPNSYRKFEWQAGSKNSLKGTAIQFRPSGIRVKAANYLPALVAMNQTSYLFDEGRFLSVQEAAKLQGFPKDFDFGGQPNQASFKQLGNAVCVGVVRYVLTETLRHFNLNIHGEKIEPTS